MKKSQALPLGQKIFTQHNSISQKINENDPQFQKNIQLYKKESYKDIVESQIFIKTNQPNQNTFVFNGSKYQSQKKQRISSFLMVTIATQIQKLKQSYCVVFLCHSFKDFLDFRGMMEKWPTFFFKKIRRIYIVGASLLVKIIEMFSFGTFYRLLDQLTLNVSNMQEAKQIDDDIVFNIGEGQTPYLKQQKKDKSRESLGKIKIIKNKLYGRKLDEYEKQNIKNIYPLVIVMLIQKMVLDQQKLKVQGIFRKSCNIQELQRLQKQIIHQDYQFILKENDIITITGCFKKIFNNLQEPLFSYSAYKLLIGFQGKQNLEQTKFLSQLLLKLPPTNYKLFILVVAFLNQFIIANKEQNRMNSYNLAVVFGPCLFRPQQYDLIDLMKSGKFARAILLFLDKFQEIINKTDYQEASDFLNQLAKTQFK